MPKGIPKAKKYIIALTVNGETDTIKTDSIADALGEFNPPKSIKGKSTLALVAGDMRSEKYLYPIQVKRLKINRISREILQKQLALLLH